MTKQHFDTEAVIISKMQEALTQIYQRNNLLAGLIVYRCAQAIRNHWNKLHKRSKIETKFCLGEALSVYNHIYKDDLKSADVLRCIALIGVTYKEH